MDSREIYTRIIVFRGNSQIDIAPYVTRAEINLGNVSSVGTGSSGGDGVVRQAFIVVQNDNDNRFSPLDANSSWNFDGATFDPLLRSNRELRIEVAAVDQGVTPIENDYELIFHGLMGDSIRSQGQTVEVELRDMSKRLQDRYITELREYGAPIEDGGVPAEQVLQQILDDEFGVGEIEILVPELPSFACPVFTVEFVSVWDILQNIVKEFGWFLGYRYHAPTNEYRLTLLEPPRDKDATSPDWQFDWNDNIYVQDLDVTDRDIRNRVVVVYRDISARRQSVTVNDAASQAEFGLRPMQIDEQDTQLIKTGTDALQMANFALDDLAGQRAANILQMPFIARVDLYDGITVADPRISSEVEFYGVESVRHTLDFDSEIIQTEAVCAGRVIGAHQRWLQMQSREGSQGNPPDDVWPVRPNTVLTVAASDTSEEGRRRADLVCDGSDDWREINRALERVGDGGQVHLLEGTFNINSPIFITSNRLLQGQGYSTVLQLPPDTIGVRVIANRENPFELPTPTHENIQVRNMTIDGNIDNQDPHSNNNGIWLRNAQKTLIEGVQVIGMSGIGVFLDMVDDSIVQGNQVRECSDIALFVWRSDNVLVANNECVDNLATEPESVQARGIEIVGAENPVVEEFRGFNIVCSNNITIGNDLGIDLDNLFDSTCNANTVSENVNALVVGSCEGVVISNNIINNNQADGLALQNCVDCEVTGNVVKGNGLEIDSFFNNITISGDRNNVQNNTVRALYDGEDPGTTNRAAWGLQIVSGDSNFITNNDLLDSGVQGSIDDNGTNTEFRPGNRPSPGGEGPELFPTYYTNFSEFPVGETPYDWWLWHFDDRLKTVQVVIEDGAPALYMDQSSSLVYMIGPRFAPAARNIEIFAELKSTITSTGTTNPWGIFLRVSGSTESRLGWVNLTADGTTLAIKRRNFTTLSGSLDSQAGLFSANVWYKARFRAEGQTFRGRIWPSANPEPVTWQVEFTDPEHQAGAKIGIGTGTNTGQTFYRQFSYAIGGATAQGN